MNHAVVNSSVARQSRNPKSMFGFCPEKTESREFLFRLYADEFGRSSLPPEQQYWTLCGKMRDGLFLQPSCEFLHATSFGICTEEQFFGVEREVSIHEDNVAACIDRRCHLIHGDIIDAMHASAHNGSFRPGFIHLDTIHEPKLAIHLLASVVELVSSIDTGPVMIALNVILQNLYRKYDRNEISRDIYNHPVIEEFLASGWELLRRGFEYDGTGPMSKTTMCSFVLKFGG